MAGRTTHAIRRAPDAAQVQREYPILFWTPQNGDRVNWKQVAFFESTARLRGLLGGNRSSKTETATADAAIDATGLLPWWLQRNARVRAYRPPPNRIWMASESYEQVREVERKLRRLIPPSLIAEWPKKDPVTIELTNGSSISLKTYGSGRDGFASADVDSIKFDEKVPEDIFSEGLARIIDRNGTITMSLTPTSGLSWIYNRLYLPWLNRHERPVEGLSVDWIKMSIYDNPFLSDEARDAVIATWSEEERLVRVYGEFVPLDGRAVFDRIRLAQIARVDAKQPVVRGEIDLVDGRPKFRELSTGRLSVWEWPKPGYAYASGWDVALGVKSGDSTCGEVLRRYDDRQVAEWHFGGDPERPGVTATRAVALAMLYNDGYLGWEVENHGHVFSERILHDNLYVKLLYREDPDAVARSSWAKVGWSTNAKTRGVLLDVLREGMGENLRVDDDACREQGIDSGLRSEQLVNELMTMVQTPTGREEASSGARDDRVFARGVALKVDRACPQEGYRQGRDEREIRAAALDERSRRIHDAKRRGGERRGGPVHDILGEHF